jgi:hypothetical protein
MYIGGFQVCWRKKQQNPKFKKSKLYVEVKPRIKNGMPLCQCNAFKQIECQLTTIFRMFEA